MAIKESKTMERVGFLILVFSTFSGIILYGEGRLEMVEASARADLSTNVDKIEHQIRIETQQRREDIREVNQKLDRIIDMLTRSRR